LQEQTLADRERPLGADHPGTLTAGASLAAAFRATGRVSEAIPLREQTVAGWQLVLGADHPDVWAARANLEAARQETDQTEPAGKGTVRNPERGSRGNMARHLEAEGHADRGNDHVRAGLCR